jgi:hypothetical protein
MVFNANVPQTLGVDIVQQSLAQTFNVGYYYLIIPSVSTNPFVEASSPKYTLDSNKKYILDFAPPVTRNYNDKLKELGFDDERFYQILTPYGNNTETGDQFLLSVNGAEYKMIVSDYKEDLSGLRNLSCKHLKEFLLE